MFEEVFANIPSTVTMVLAAGVILFGGLIRGFIGFGGALMIIPTLAVIFTPKEAVALHLMMEIPGTLQLMPAGIRNCDRRTVIPTLAAIMLAMPVGAFALATVDPQPMRIAISIFVLIMVFLLAMDWRYPGKIGTGVLSVSGGISGVVQGATGMGGPPVAAILLSRKDDDDTTRGNMMLLMGSIVLVAFPVQWYFGILTAKTVMLGLFAGVIYVLATWLGSRFYHFGGQRIYRQSALGVLGAIALWSYYSAIIRK